jgi:DNA-binding transcriptional LysR family regulator
MEPLKTLDLDAVRAFALVATLANFTRVAEVTGTTQSAVSLMLKRLETFLGRRLVERTPRSVRLTIDGEAFLAHAKNLLAANERALAFSLCLREDRIYSRRRRIQEYGVGRSCCIQRRHRRIFRDGRSAKTPLNGSNASACGFVTQ